MLIAFRGLFGLEKWLEREKNIITKQSSRQSLLQPSITLDAQKFGRCQKCSKKCGCGWQIDYKDVDYKTLPKYKLFWQNI